MKKTEKKPNTRSKVILSIVFVVVFLVNVIVVLQKDNKTGAISFSPLKSYAQVEIRCSSGDSGQCFSENYSLFGGFCYCDYTGGTLDCCDSNLVDACNGNAQAY